MKKANVLKAQNAFVLMSKLYEALEEDGVVKSPIKGVTLPELLRMDIAEYMMYLSAADGLIEKNEVRLFRAITGFKDGAEGIIEHIKDNNIYSVAYESNVPYSMHVAIEADEAYFEATGQNRDPSLPEILLDLYENIGLLLIQADDDISQSERRDFNIYLNTLKEYMKKRVTEDPRG